QLRFPRQIARALHRVLGVAREEREEHDPVIGQPRHADHTSGSRERVLTWSDLKITNAGGPVKGRSVGRGNYFCMHIEFQLCMSYANPSVRHSPRGGFAGRRGGRTKEGHMSTLRTWRLAVLLAGGMSAAVFAAPRDPASRRPY